MAGFHLSCGTCRTLFWGICILHCADFEMLQSILRNKSLHRRWFNVLLWKLQQIINVLGFSGVMLKFCHLILLETIAGPKTIEGGIYSRNLSLTPLRKDFGWMCLFGYGFIFTSSESLEDSFSCIFLSDIVLLCCTFMIFRVDLVLLFQVGIGF